VGRGVSIVGYGAVGKHLQGLFPDAAVYDKPLRLGSREDVNRCRYAFVAVPTNERPDGSADTSIVEETVSWLETELIVIRSTVPVGTTERLKQATGKRIVFQPEYGPGETPDHHFNSARRINWVILGGDRADTVAVADLYKRTFNAELVIQQTDSRTAELTKYMENCFLALKVTFCNEFYDLAQRLSVDYNELRELWLLDPRIGRSHTFVMPDERGFGGKCLPKDVAAMVHTASTAGYAPQLLMAMLDANAHFRGAANGKALAGVHADRD
jgi:UDPglucose 6-dehydrogenase